MNKKFYVYVISGMVLLFYGLLLNNRYIDSYNHKKYADRMYNEANNYILTETESDSIRLNMDMELASFTNGPCQLNDVVRLDTMYLILTVPMNYWVNWTFELIQKLETEREKIPCVQIKVIIYGSTLRDMKVNYNFLKERFSVYMTPLGNIGLPVEKSNKPCLIFINDMKTAGHSLMFDNGSTRYLNEFIKILSEKYCK